MEKIDLFDRYIKDELTAAEQSEFNARLKSDSDFASAFRTYLMTVRGICQEAEQNNMDFAMAMKKLSKEQLLEIIGKKKSDANCAAALCAANVFEPEGTDSKIAAFQAGACGREPKSIRFKPSLWHIASIAAVVLIAVTVVFRTERNCRYDIDAAIYACTDVIPVETRGGSKTIDITKLDDSQLRDKLPELEAVYKSSGTDIEIADNGFALAMAYVRLHDRDNAKLVLNELIGRFDGNDDYTASVNRWESILEILK